MSNVCDEADGGLSPIDLEKIVSKRMVFIVDECHRSTFGDMLYDIKKTFPRLCFSDLPELRFIKKTKKNSVRQPLFLGMNCTDTVSLTE